MVEFRSGADSKGYSLKLWVDQTSQSTANNTSQVRLRLYLINTRMTFAQYTINASITADGQRIPYSGSPSVLSYNSTTQLIDRTITIKHTDSGAKSFAVSATLSGSGGYSPNTISISNQTFTLKTIARSSSIAVPSLTLGSPSTLTIKRTNSSYKHTVRWQLGDKSGVVASNVGEETQWTPSIDLASAIPNSKQANLTIFVDTYSGSSKIGTSQTTVSVSVPESSQTKPSLTGITLVDSNAKLGSLTDQNTFVQVFSNIMVQFDNASAKYGATISGYSAEIIGHHQTTRSNGGSLGPMNWNGSAVVRATVTDSRGMTSAPVDVTINVLEYSPPVLSFTARRGNQSESSKTIVVTRNAKISPLMINGKQTNTFKLTFKVAESGTNQYVTDNGSANTNSKAINSYVNSNGNLGGTYDNFKTYDVLGILEDNFTSTEFRTTVTTEKGVWGEAETAFSFGKVPELKEAVDSDWQYYYKNKPIQHHQLTEVDGNALEASAIGFNDWNNILKTGNYYGIGLTNAPENGFCNVSVVSYNDVVTQQAMTEDGLYYRCFKSRVWSSWTKMVMDNHPNLTNTGWVGTGVDNVSAKKVGDIVHINFNDIPLTKGQGYHLGKLPENMLPNSALMFEVAVWVVNNETVKIQLNKDGTLAVIGSTVSQSRNLRTQISFVI